MFMQICVHMGKFFRTRTPITSQTLHSYTRTCVGICTQQTHNINDIHVQTTNTSTNNKRRNSLTEVLSRGDVGESEEREVLPDMKEPGEQVEQRGGRPAAPQRVREEVVVEEGIEHSWEAEEGHA